MTERPRAQDSSGDFLFVALVIVGFAATVAHWLAAQLATLVTHGHALDATYSDSLAALRLLPEHLNDPRLAWPEPSRSDLPGPIVYWTTATVVVVVLVAAVCVGYVWLTGQRYPSPDQRVRLGVPTQARLARTRDLRPLLTKQPEPNRLVLARWGRRKLISTEGGAAACHRAVAGAVAVFGPSQSGKTTGLIDGVNAWSGPAVVSSVKADLLRATIDQRATRGSIKIFDPEATTGLPSATWSPLGRSKPLAGALATAQALAWSGTDNAPTDNFWRGQAEQLIAALLWTAANTDGHTMRHVVRWVLELDRPDGNERGTLAPLIRLLTDSADGAIALDAKQVQGWLHGHWSADPRTTSSVYATARNAVWPWADPRVAASADSCEITLDWLLDGANTLYLVAPLGDQTRVGAVFTVLLHQLITEAFEHSNRAGHPFDPRLLVLLDEAGNTPLPRLPQWAATVSGPGIQLVTVWQSKSQIDATYQHDADAVLTNHRTKLVYPSGMTDTSTVHYVSELVGDEHLRADLGNSARTPDGPTPATQLPFIPPSTFRRAAIGDALLLHGNLPPAWIRGRTRAPQRGQ